MTANSKTLHKTKILKAVLVWCFFFYTSWGFSQIKDTISSETSISDSLNHTPDSLIWISPDAVESVIHFSCKDSFPIFFQENTMLLYGDAQIEYQNITLKADRIILNWSNNTLIANGIKDSSQKNMGYALFKEGEQEYKAKKMVYNFKTKKAKIYDLITSEGENYIHASEVKKDSNNVIYGIKAKFTTCENEDPHFYIAATKIKILKNKIITGPAYLVIEEIPVPLAVPFGFFPKQNKRTSGIIMPAYGESTNRGFYLRGLGYYLPVNDYLDILLKGDIYSRGSWLVNVHSNYVKRYKFRGSLDIKYAHNRFGDPLTPDFQLDKDFSISWTHNQDPKARPNSTFSARVNAGSRNSFRNNFTNPGEILQNNLSSSVTYSKTFAGTPFSMSASITHTQNLSTGNISLSAPTLSFNMRRITPFKRLKGVSKKTWYSDIGLNYSMNMRNQLNTVDTLFLTPESWNEWKRGIQHNLPVSTSFKIMKYITFSPSITYSGRTYFERNRKKFVQATDTTENDTIIDYTEKGLFQLNDVSFSANLSTRLYGLFNINKWGLIAVRHQMTPSMSISYHPDLSKGPFSVYDSVQEDRYQSSYLKYNMYQNNIMGYPAGTRQGLINFNVSNNLEAKIQSSTDTTSKDKTKKIKLIDNLNFSMRYNLFADSMKWSSVYFSGRTSLFSNKMNIQVSGELDPYAISSDSIRIDKIALFNGQKPFRLTRTNLTFNTSFRAPSRKNKKEEKIGFYGNLYDQYMDFDIPWSLSMNYTVSYSNFSLNSSGQIVNDPRLIQTLNFNGNMNLTPKWKINISSGYDLKAQKFTFTSVDIYRDLHCWEMSFSWIPFGSRQSYMFKLNVKSSTLKDLKIDKKKYYYDY